MSAVVSLRENKRTTMQRCGCNAYAHVETHYYVHVHSLSRIKSILLHKMVLIQYPKLASSIAHISKNNKFNPCSNIKAMSYSDEIKSLQLLN